MNGNLGYQFYRCTYRESMPGTNRLKETLIAQNPLAVTQIAPDLEALAPRVKPYRPEDIPPVDETAPAETLEAAVAAFQARFGGQHNSRNNRNQRNAQTPAQPARDVNRERKQAEQAARTVNGIAAFELKVLYPGLYAGLGYAHGLPGQNSDIKVGFSFDYTTGLPFIPGSSLKGTLRSMFINLPEDTAAAFGIPVEALRGVEDVLFGNRVTDEDAHPGCLICHDVFPIGISEGATLMAMDNITPHKNPLAPPVPINTLRLRPGTVLRFSFALPEEIPAEGGPLSRRQILNAFRTLLEDWGIGAKTNVGYGSLGQPDEQSRNHR